MPHSILTSWRCPGLGPGKASRELVDEGEREQRPRGLCDVSKTCNWQRIWLFLGDLKFHWSPGWEWRWRWTLSPWNRAPPQSGLFAGEHISPKIFAQSSSSVFGIIRRYLGWELKLNDYLLFKIIPNADLVPRIPGELDFWYLKVFELGGKTWDFGRCQPWQDSCNGRAFQDIGDLPLLSRSSPVFGMSQEYLISVLVVVVVVVVIKTSQLRICLWTCASFSLRGSEL